MVLPIAEKCLLQRNCILPAPNDLNVVHFCLVEAELCLCYRLRASADCTSILNSIVDVRSNLKSLEETELSWIKTADSGSQNENKRK